MLRSPCTAVALAGLVLVLSLKSAGGEEPAAGTADRRKVVRETYASVPPLVFQMKEPLLIFSSSRGIAPNSPESVSIHLNDADGRIHWFTWNYDKRFPNREFDRIYWQHAESSAKPMHGPFRLAPRGPEEAALYGLLIRMEQAWEKQANSELLDRERRKWARPFLDGLDKRFANEPPVLQK